MKKASILIVTTMLLGWAIFAVPAHAQVPEAKKQLIAELLDKTGTKQLAMQVSNQMIKAMSDQYAKQNNMTPAQLEQVQMAISSVFQESMDSGEYYEMIYPIYDKYFSEPELKQIIAFYDTPVGRKFIEVMPHITKDAMQVGQEWVTSLIPKIQQRVQETVK